MLNNIKAKRLIATIKHKLSVIERFDRIGKHFKIDLQLSELISDIENDIEAANRLLGKNESAMEFSEQSSSSVFTQLHTDLNYINSKFNEFIEKFPISNEPGESARYERSVLIGLSNLVESLRTAISGVLKKTETISGPEIKLAASLQKSVKQVRTLIDGLKDMKVNGDYKKEINELWSACTKLEHNFWDYQEYLTNAEYGSEWLYSKLPKRS